MISGLPSVLDYGNLTLNGRTGNIELEDDEVAVLGEVSINVL